MTCIVGVCTPHNVVLAADSVTTTGLVQQTKTSTKIFRIGPLVFGTSGTARFHDILKHRLEDHLPEFIGRPDQIDEYVHTHLIDSIHAALDMGKALSMENGVAMLGGSALIALGNRLFVMCVGGSIIEPADGYAATGSGVEVALGALFATPPSRSAEWRARLGVAAASHFIESCGGLRVDVLKTKRIT